LISLRDLARKVHEETGHHPTKLTGMLSKNLPAEVVVRRLVLPATETEITDTKSGFDVMFREKRLDLTVEHLVAVNPQWHDLIGRDVIKMAEARLEFYRRLLVTKTNLTGVPRV
jgi:hypothetical protein